MQLLREHLELYLRDLGPPLVDLGVRPGGRIDHGGRRARLGGDAHEVVEDRLGGELLDDPRSRPSAREPRRDDRHLEDLQRAGDVDALATGERQHFARAVAKPDLEHRNRQRSVERSVRRHGDDHVSISHRLRTVRFAYHFAFAQTRCVGDAPPATRCGRRRRVGRPRTSRRGRPLARGHRQRHEQSARQSARPVDRPTRMERHDRARRDQLHVGPVIPGLGRRVDAVRVDRAAPRGI